MNLVIVESPTKAKTISRFLGRDYKVLSSFGHVRDLPKGKLGIDTEKGFAPSYVIPRSSNKALTLIKKAVKSGVDKVILATDEDREGEAIAYHLKWIIGKAKKSQKFERITFHEITKTAIQKALENPREIDTNLFNAQQARRVLDRLVGYNLSPLLWKKIRRGLSAGRVQSVALRLIVEREREREAFKSEEFWTIEALLAKDKQAVPEERADVEADPRICVARLTGEKEKKYSKLEIKNEAQAAGIKTDLENAEYLVQDVIKKQVRRNPAPPYRTSTLQRDAANKLGFSAKQTMMIAQQLYEGIRLEKGNVGLITYMRTDSLHVAPSALKKAREVIAKKFGDAYALEEPRHFRKKAKGAQEAHEAIRPTFPQKDPESVKKYLDNRQYRLYTLIWQQFIASQMKEAVFDKAIIEITADKYRLKAEGSILKFPGYLRIYGEKPKIKETRVPDLSMGDKLMLLRIDSGQHFTVPPARYTDATLIKALEENGIGRPSTYAPTLSTIVTRGYTEKDENKQYVPQEIGFLVNDLLVENFQEIVDLAFTAQMEASLDDVASGGKDWIKVIEDFYRPFAKELVKKGESIEKYSKETGKACPQCGKPLVEKFGRFGKFFACSGFPDCKYTEDSDKAEHDKLKDKMGEMTCEKCGAPMEIKRGRFGIFWGCSRYPDCKTIKKIENSSGVTCPQCGKGEIVQKKSRKGFFWACNNYPDCKFVLNGKPTGEQCPSCGSLMIENFKTGDTRCSSKDCKG